MYTPSAFECKDPGQIRHVIDSYGFATLVSRDGASSFASHLPFLYKPYEGAKGKIISHMAKANRHWQLFNPQEEALVIFSGPHAYISPTWYVAEQAVPTWNYVTVHVYGTARIMDSSGKLEAVLDETVAKYESGQSKPWIPNLPQEMMLKLHQAIVGFEIEITRIEAKFKLGQNRSREDQEKMRLVLENSGDADSILLAKMMGAQGSINLSR